MALFGLIKTNKEKIRTAFKSMGDMANHIRKNNMEINKKKLQYYRSRDKALFEEIKAGIDKQSKMIGKAKNMLEEGNQILNNEYNSKKFANPKKLRYGFGAGVFVRENSRGKAINSLYTGYEYRFEYLELIEEIIALLHKEVCSLAEIYNQEKELSSNKDAFLENFHKLFKKEMLCYENLEKIFKKKC